MKRIKPSIALTLAALLVAPAVSLAAGGSSSSVPAAADVPELTPQQKAINAYNQGLEYRNKAWKLEEEAASAEGAKAAKKAAKAQKAYRKAIGQFRMATKHVANFHQAYSSLGYALRKTGQYQESLEAYDQALAIAPNYPEAIEYRGEAFLGLDRIEEAKGAYMQLFRIDRERAAELMTAMRSWLEERRQDAGALSEEEIEGFATWVEERSDLVAQVGTLASVDRRW
ncbi:MAG: tetratricopeptide repeat protein [Thermoanaerobaculia bacterium]